MPKPDSPLMRFVSTLAAHPRALRWSAAALSGVVLVGGIMLGAESASAPQASFETQQTAARVPAAQHSVVGEVRAVGPSEFLVRGPKGALFAIRWSPSAQFRSAGKAVPPSTLKAGDQVVVIGRPAADGSLIANRITIAAPRQPADPAAS
jgi:hypothetical protein